MLGQQGLPRLLYKSELLALDIQALQAFLMEIRVPLQRECGGGDHDVQDHPARSLQRLCTVPEACHANAAHQPRRVAP